MSLFSHSSLLLISFCAPLAIGSAGCASQPPPAAAAAPPSQAFQQASSPGAAEQQGDGVVFVDQDRKEPTTHQDGAPVTGLKADTHTARPQH